MLTKILLVLIVALAVLFVLPKTLRAAERLLGPKPPAAPPARQEDLVRCPSCGIYRPARGRCACEGPPPGGN